MGGLSTPKAGEKTYLWALQNGDDIQNRLPLPTWISEVLEMRICRFVTDHGKWQSAIAKRVALNRDLTKTQQTKYDAFVANCTQKFVFDKKKKKCIDDAATLKRNMKNCIAFKLHLSDDSDQLRVESANGQLFRLLWLKQEHHLAGAAMPEVLDHPATADDLAEEDGEEHDNEDGDENQQDQDDGGQLEAVDMQMDHERAAAEDMTESDHDEDVELLADTDDEAGDFGLTSENIKLTKVKGFDLRPAWQALASEGLTDLPRHIKGCSVSYHSTTKQWQGHYVNSRVCMSSIWGGSSKRTEREAILRAIRGVLESHLQVYPRDSMWARQLSKVQHAEATLK